MSDVPPSLPPGSGPLSQIQPPAPGSVILPHPPVAIQSLPAGTRVEATVTDILAPVRGEVRLATPYGQVTARLPAPLVLATGTRLVLEIAENRSSVAMVLRMIKVNNASWPQSPSSWTGHATTPATTTEASVWQTTPTTGLPAQIIAAPDRVFPNWIAQAGSLPILPTGTTLLVRLAGILPVNPTQPPSVTLPSTVPSTPTPHIETALTGTKPPPVMDLSSDPTKTSQGTAPSRIIPGIVTPNTNSGQTVISTPVGLISTGSTLPLPPGTPVQLDVLNITPPVPLPVTSASPAANTRTVVVRAWPELERILDLVMRSGGPDSIKELIRSLPTGDGRMIAAINTLGQLSRPGVVRVWPGETVRDALEQAGGRGRDALRTLVAEVGETMRRGTDGGADWRVQNLPFLDGSIIEKITLVSRRDGEQENEQQDNRQKRGDRLRFLFNVNLSRLGPIQFDGLYQKGDRRLDLVVRTHTPLKPDIRNDMSGLYAQSSEALRLKGTLSFQISATFAGPADTMPGQSDQGPGLIV